jgi:DNA-binding NarL/FixJ family response regulator
MNPPDGLHVLIVAQNPLARIGLSALLASQPGFSVVGEMSGGADLLAEIAAYHPDVLVWDLDWAASLEQLAALSQPMPPVVALVPDESYTADAWAAGARGVLSHNANAETLAAALAAVSLGMAVFDPSFAVALFPPRMPALDQSLTAREREVLQLLAEGAPNKIIASRLGISEHTVKFHVNAILSKLGVQSRTEAVVRAARLGLILL